MRSDLAEFFRHHLWANLRLLDVCAGLPDEQLDLTEPGTYGRVRDTLTHLAAAENRYIGWLSGEPPDERVSEKAGFPGMPALRESMQRTGERLIDFAAKLRPDDMLAAEWRGERFETPTVVPLMQALDHGSEHRAHIVSVLTQHGVDVPSRDAWSYWQAASRV